MAYNVAGEQSMSAIEPSRHNPEHISLNIKVSTGESQEHQQIPALSPSDAQTRQEQSTPPISTDGSLEQRAFKKEPSVEDQESISSEQTEGPINDDMASFQQAESIEADTVETKTSSTEISSQDRFISRGQQGRHWPWRRGPSRPRSKKWRVFQVSLVLLLLLSTVTGIIVVPRLYRTYASVKSVTNQTLPHVQTTGQPIPSPTSLPNDLAGLNYLNLLLLGSDTDSKFEGGRVLTQTDIVVRIDLAHHHVTMLSLPRDLWVPSDEGWCCAKLDEISLNETDGATTPLEAKLHGFAHTIATIEQDFHIPINAYAWVGLDGFIKVIDTIGGVDMDVIHPVVDDTYPSDTTTPNSPYSYERVYLAPGPQHLDGKTALEYVRSRHGDLLEDVGRTARQQALLLALKQKLDNPDVFTHLDEVATDLQGSVLTSLSIQQVLELANFARGLKAQDFSQMALGLPDYGYGETIDSYEGVIWVEEPLWGAITQTINQVFPESATSKPMSLQSLTPTDYQMVQKERAHVLIENGSQDAAAGNKLKAVLAKDGFIVSNVQQADHPYLVTQIENVNPQSANTSRILGQLFGVLASTSASASPKGVDIILILGQDSAASVEATG
jgi:LCP family protein required for cell wall assembly